MDQSAIRQTIALLVRVSNCTIQDFYYFPQVIISCKQRIEKEEFDFLLSEGYICQYKFDSFGRFYKLTKKADDFIFQTVTSSRSYHGRRRLKVPLNQGSLNFA